MESLLTDEYGVKIALVEEYKKVLKYKKIYEDLIESFQSIIAIYFTMQKKTILTCQTEQEFTEKWTEQEH